MTTELRNNESANRYELYIDGALAAFEDYHLSPGLIAFNHTEAMPEFRGQGAAAQLVAGILADARARGLGVLPYCPYVATVIRRNPEQYLDLVPAARRAEFKLPLDVPGPDQP